MEKADTNNEYINIIRIGKINIRLTLYVIGIVMQYDL